MSLEHNLWTYAYMRGSDGLILVDPGWKLKIPKWHQLCHFEPSDIALLNSGSLMNMMC
jgi:hypothetical protein